MNVNPPIFSRRASSTNAPPPEIEASREAAASRRAASWGSDVDLEEMESEQTGLAFSLPPSPDRARANSPVEFLPDWGDFGLTSFTLFGSFLEVPPLLPSKLCRTTSALIGKSYIAAGQAGMALQTMAILQAY